MPSETPRRTPLYSEHLKLGAKIVPFAGFEMPVQYRGVLEETKQVRTACGLFDVSHMGQFSIRGPGALAAVQALVTNDLTRLSVGQAQYNLLCDEKGGVLDDLVVYRRSETEIYICVNACNRATDFAWFRSHLPATVTFLDLSDQTALLAVQGPRAEALLCEATDPDAVRQMKYYWAAEARVFGTDSYLSRTGYTGEDGFEIYLPSEKAAELWNTFLEVGRRYGLSPIGLGARDTLRLEMGYPLHGHEISTAGSPLEAGLKWAVKLERTTPFIGQEFLRAQALRGPDRKLRALVVEDRRIARQGYRIANEQFQFVGEITSGTFSPHVQAPVALGYVSREASEADRYFVEVRGSFIPARAVKLPFVPSGVRKGK